MSDLGVGFDLAADEDLVEDEDIPIGQVFRREQEASLEPNPDIPGHSDPQENRLLTPEELRTLRDSENLFSQRQFRQTTETRAELARTANFARDRQIAVSETAERATQEPPETQPSPEFLEQFPKSVVDAFKATTVANPMMLGLRFLAGADEAGEQLLAGALDGTLNTLSGAAEITASFADFQRELVGPLESLGFNLGQDVGRAAQFEVTRDPQPDAVPVDLTEVDVGSAIRDPVEAILSTIPRVPSGDTLRGKIARDVGKLVVVMIPASSGLGISGVSSTAVRGLQTGALGSFFGLEGRDRNLFDLIDDWVPAVKGPVLDYLTTNENDSELFGRVKNTLADGIFGVGFEFLSAGARRLIGVGANSLKLAKLSGELQPGSTIADIEDGLARQIPRDLVDVRPLVGDDAAELVARKGNITQRVGSLVGEEEVAKQGFLDEIAETDDLDFIRAIDEMVADLERRAGDIPRSDLGPGLDPNQQTVRQQRTAAADAALPTERDVGITGEPLVDAEVLARQAFEPRTTQTVEGERLTDIFGNELAPEPAARLREAAPPPVPGRRRGDPVPGNESVRGITERQQRTAAADAALPTERDVGITGEPLVGDEVLARQAFEPRTTQTVEGERPTDIFGNELSPDAAPVQTLREAGEPPTVGRTRNDPVPSNITIEEARARVIARLEGLNLPEETQAELVEQVQRTESVNQLLRTNRQLADIPPREVAPAAPDPQLELPNQAPTISLDRGPDGKLIADIPLNRLPEEELELQEFIRRPVVGPDGRRRVGIVLQGEELSGELERLISPKFAGRNLGLMNNQSGFSLQEMAERASEAGFIRSANKADLLEVLGRSRLQEAPQFSELRSGLLEVQGTLGRGGGGGGRGPGGGIMGVLRNERGSAPAGGILGFFRNERGAVGGGLFDIGRPVEASADALSEASQRTILRKNIQHNLEQLTGLSPKVRAGLVMGLKQERPVEELAQIDNLFGEAVTRQRNEVERLAARPTDTGGEPTLRELGQDEEDATDVFRRTYELVDTYRGRRFTQRRGGVRPRAMVDEEGQALVDAGRFGQRDVRALAPGTVLNDEKVSALSHVLMDVGAQAQKSADAWLQSGAVVGSPESRQFAEAFSLFAELDPTRYGIGTEAARALGIRNDPISSMNQFLNQISEVVDSAGDKTLTQIAEEVSSLSGVGGDLLGGVSEDVIREIARRLSMSESLDQAVKFGVQAAQLARRGSLSTAKKPSILLELYINSLLSGPMTYARNFGSNAFMALWRPAVHIIASPFNKDISFREGLEMYHAIGGGLSDAFKLVSQGLDERRALADSFGGITTLKGARSIVAQRPGSLDPGLLGQDVGEIAADQSLGAGKFLEVNRGQPAITRGNVAERLQRPTFLAKPLRPLTAPLGRAIENQDGLGTFIDILGEIGRTPTRSLGAADEFFKAVAFRQGLRKEAMRKVTRDGLRGQAAVDAARELISSPDSKFAEQVADRAHEFAREQTFTNDLGEAGQAFMNFMHRAPWMRVVLPFVKTPTQIVSNTLQSIPGLNVLSARSRAALLSGNTTERAEAIGRLTVGSGLIGLGAYLASIGVVTGRGPEHAGTRFQLMSDEPGWKPWSIRIGGQYFSFNGLDPVMIPFGMGATIHEAVVNADPSDGAFELIDKTANTAIMAISESVLNRSYLRGISNVVSLLMPRHQQEEDAAKNFVKQFSRRFAPSFVPGSSLLRQLTKETDPIMRETFGHLDPIWAMIPGLSKSLFPRRNLWGDETYVMGALSRPVISELYGHGRSREAALVLAESGYEVNKVSKRIGLPRLDKRVELRPEEYDALVLFSAGRNIDGSFAPGKPLQDRIEDLGRSGGWLDRPVAERHDRITQVISQFRRRARSRLLREFPEIRERGGVLLERQNRTGGVRRNPALRRQLRTDETKDQIELNLEELSR